MIKAPPRTIADTRSEITVAPTRKSGGDCGDPEMPSLFPGREAPSTYKVAAGLESYEVF
jgi:hypothetical protein